MQIFLRYIFGFIVILAVASGVVLVLSQPRDSQSAPVLRPAATVEPIASAFSLEKAPRNSLRGGIATMSGDVKWQSRVATEEAILTTPREIQQGERLETGRFSNATVTFSGACQVDLAPETEVSFIQTLPTNIALDQEKGIGKYAKAGNAPVAIRAGNLLVQDEGTLTININQINGDVTVRVASGSATLAYNDLNLISHEITLLAGQIYYFSDGRRRGVRE